MKLHSYSGADPVSRKTSLAHPLLVSWVIYIILTPIYIFPSGYPQPADLILAVMVAVLFTGYFVRVAIFPDLYLVGSAFLCIVIFVNGYSWAVYGEKTFLFAPLYYVFNFFNLVLVASLFRRFGGDFVTAARAALIAATLVELAACLLLPQGGLRAVGTFNSPNQLGYWSLLTAACLLVLKGRERMDSIELVVLCLLGYLGLLSLSKGALGGLLLLVILAVCFQGVSRRQGLILVLSALLLAGPILMLQPERVQNFFDDGLLGAFASRFGEAQNTADDSLAGRGYDRIWLYPEYLVFGAGEGGFWRFVDSQLIGSEMHSSFGTILFSYGMMGAALFAIFLWLVFRHSLKRHAFYFLPIVFYGLTHQGLRFSLLWTFLGIVFAAARYGDRAAASAGGRGRSSPAGEAEGDAVCSRGTGAGSLGSRERERAGPGRAPRSPVRPVPGCRSSAPWAMR